MSESSSNKIGFGKACTVCGRSLYNHPGERVGNCTHLRLVSYKMMKDSISGDLFPVERYVPDSPYPRTKSDPRVWAINSRLEKERLT